MMEFMLSGSESRLTTDNDSVITVLSGKVLIYLLPVRDAKQGRKLLLSEMEEGGRIPSLSYTDGEQTTWCLEIRALDGQAALSQKTDEEREKTREDFAGLVSIPNVSRIGYEEAIAEVYRLHQVKDDAFIYQVDRDSRSYYEKGLKEIYKSFQGKSARDEAPSTENSLYEALRCLCGEKGILLESYENICRIAGRNFTVEDAGRLSGFAVRQVRLSASWYKKDSGILLGFRKENGEAVVLIPAGPDHYQYYSPISGKRETVGDRSAKELQNRAYVIYRPLSSEKVTEGDIFRFLLRDLSRSDAFRFVLLSLSGIAAGVFSVFCCKRIFDGLISQSASFGLFWPGLLFMACLIGNLFFRLALNIARLRMTAAGKNNLQAALYHRVFQLPESVLSSVDSADLAERILGFSEECAGLFSLGAAGVMSLVSLLVYGGIMFHFSALFAGTAFGVLLIRSLCCIVLSKSGTKIRREVLSESGKLYSEYYQDLQGIEKIRLSGSENNILYRYIRRYLSADQLKHRERKRNTAYRYAKAAAEPLLLCLILFLTAFLPDSITAGEFAAFSVSCCLFSAALSSLTGFFTALTEYGPVWERIRFLFDHAPESAAGLLRPVRLKGKIDLDSLFFAYQPEEGNVLDGISIHISPGEYVGIVGSSGSGKSTLLKMLLGFLCPDKGRVYYDSTDLETLDKRELRRKMGVVLQNDHLISGSVADNLRITAPDLSTERMWELLDEVGLKEEIENLPMGLQTVLSAENPTISGGQLQRLLIARALAPDPKILLLDEATSALDQIAQSRVCDVLKSLKATKIVIAHRLSTVASCDRIIVLEKGRIAEEGTYKELLERNGIFARMAARQSM